MANFVPADRTQDTVASVSGSTVTLNGAPPTGSQSFNAGVGDGNTSFYCLFDTAGHWEVSYGAYTNSSTSLARAATPLASSNAGAQVAAFSGATFAMLVDPATYLGAILAGRQSGRLYTNAWGTFSAGNQISVAAGTVWYLPVFIGQPFSSFVIHFNLASLFAGVSTLDVGLYSNLNGAPNARLGQQTGINSGTGGSTGDNATSTITPASPQPPGWYWLAMVAHTNSATLVYCNSNGDGTSPGLVSPMGPPSTASNLNASGWQQTSATLPATAASLSAVGGSGNVPGMALAATL